MMGNDEQLDHRISAWLESEAPRQLPDHVLRTTFERTRGSRQEGAWRRILAHPVHGRLTAVVGASGLLVAGALALGVLGAGVGGSPSPAPSTSPSLPPDDARAPFVGTWTSGSDLDGGLQTMTVTPADDGSVAIVVTDTIASVCEGTPSTMTGTGSVAGAQLVIPAPDYRCDDGREARSLNGQPLADLLANLTYELDRAADVLRVGDGVWERAATATPDASTEASTEASANPGSDEGPVIWPQTSIEAVRRAQALADNGEPVYPWQLGGGRFVQPGQHHPMNDEFFQRFTREVLGWEAATWTEAFAHRDGLEGGDVIYVRCDPSGVNLLYPVEDTDNACGPTIDDVTYETVRIHVTQPVREGETGLFVVTDWERIEPARQAIPPSEAEIATLVDAFGAARVAGSGAEALVDMAPYDPLAAERAGSGVPLLYATTTGAPFVRWEHEALRSRVWPGSPAWPGGQLKLTMRLFAEDGTVVEQPFTAERNDAGELRLVYASMDGDVTLPSTTENGEAVPLAYSFLDGAVTYRVVPPFAPSLDGFRQPDRVAVDGLLPDDGAPRKLLLMLADPWPIGTGCAAGPRPADAAALASSLQADPVFSSVSDPEPVTVGGRPALRLDVVRADGAPTCAGDGSPTAGSRPLLFIDREFGIFGDHARLWLVDLPGEPGRILVLATISDEDSLQTILPYAEPIVDSIEIREP